MIESSIDKTKGSGMIVACPNMSGRWKTTRELLWVFSIFIMLIAAGFAWFGMWLIIPFAGFEVIALVSLSYWVAYQCGRQEVIQISDNHITVEKGHSFPSFSWKSEIFWTRLIVVKPHFKGHPLRLYLRGKRERLEIGSFLNDDEKKKIIDELRGVVNILK